MGVGIDGFNITGESEEWSDWLGAGEDRLAAIKTWLGYSVLLLFDPPDNATVLKAIQQTVDKSHGCWNPRAGCRDSQRRSIPSSMLKRID